MNREEYLVYCLLYAIDAANVKKQNLVQMSLKVDTVNFVKIYNVIQQQDEATRKNVIAKHADLYDKKEMIEEIRNTFLSELEPSIQEKICKYL
jgi:aminoglycoside N3'-acetyltransferase